MEICPSVKVLIMPQGNPATYMCISGFKWSTQSPSRLELEVTMGQIISSKTTTIQNKM